MLNNLFLIFDEVFVRRKKGSLVLEVGKLKIADLFNELSVSHFRGIAILGKHPFDVLLFNKVKLFVELVEKFFLDELILNTVIHNRYNYDSFL